MSDPQTSEDAGCVFVDTGPNKTVTEELPDNSFDNESKVSTVGSEMKDNQDTVASDKEQTIETVENFDNAEQSNSRELKLLLALSRESNLDTNISRKIKRKTTEYSKTDKKYHLHGKLKHKHMNSNGKSPKKSIDGKPVRYPVTAESELESDLSTANDKIETNSENSIKRKRENLTEDASLGGATDESSKKLRKSLSNEVIMFKPNKDMFCWRCHRDGVNIACETCVRSYHQKCLKQTIVDPEHWPCPECVSILKAESVQSRSQAMKGMTLEHLCSLLKFAVNRMIQCQSSEPFIHPVNDKEFPEYKKYIIQPMSLTLLEKNIKDNVYGSPQAFEADAKWILHNSIIFNSFQSKLTYVAKNIIKICKQEMAEIENCPSCYLNANTKKKTWFTEVCPRPHLIVWAKLKGFPYWPAKIMCCKDDLADVRFFGAHDRAWVPYRDCFLFSLKDPNSFKQRRHDIEQCIDELKVYVNNLKKIYGEVKYAAYKTLIDPYNETKQLQIFLPNFGKSDSVNKDMQRKQSTENQVDEENECKENEDDNASKKEHTKSDDLLNDEESMEGYGTDDESMANIDTEKRRKLLEIGEKYLEEDVDAEDEDDTQVLSVTASVLKKCARTRGGFHNVGGKLKVIPRKSTDSDSKQSPENKLNSLEIPARRNSESSVKSDSSHVSNHSDKINRVDISENVEISLRNDADYSISETVSLNNSECSRSDSEVSVDLKRKPVQVDIENTEYTISPSNKLKISDKLMKRLSDEGDESKTTNKRKVDNLNPTIITDETSEKIGDQSSKSQTDLLIEKFKEVVQHKVVDFSCPPTESKCEANKSNLQDCNISLIKQKTLKVIYDVPANSENHKESQIPDASMDADVKNKSYELVEEEKKSLVSDSEITSLSDKNKIDTISTTMSNNNIGNIENTETGKNNEQTVILNQSKEVVSESSETHSKTDCKQIQSNETVNKGLDKSIEVESEKISSSDNQQKENSSEPLNIIEEVMPDEDDHESTLDETQIDQASIMSIIHSSLDISNKSSFEDKSLVDKIAETKKSQRDKTTKSKTTEGSIISPGKITELDSDKNKPASEATRKRKASEGIGNSLNKVFKLVPLNASTSSDNENSKPLEKSPEPMETSEHTENHPILLKSLSGSQSTTNETSPRSLNSVEEVCPIEIKSEPDSEVEPENLEAKKKYLSALQIAEKKDIPELANSNNHIRTRARAEEKRERFKHVDNLAKIIDDVALNYGPAQQAKDLPLKRSEKPRSYSNLNKKEGEIFVKSFAKMIPKQRARKSFPMPNYAKPKIIINHKDGITPNKNATKVTSVTTKPQTTSLSNCPAVSLASKSVTTVKSVNQNAVIAQPLEAVKTSNGYLVLQSPQSNEIVLLSNQSISFSTQSTNQAPVVSKAGAPNPSVTISAKPIPPKRIIEMTCSQNYIPQNEEQTDSESVSPLRNCTTNNSEPPVAKSVSTSQQSTPVPGGEIPKNLQQSQGSNEQGTTETQTDEEFSVLNSMMPENVSKTISTLLRRPPPKLKPRPPGMLSTNFAEGNPSTAGDITSRINSVAHRLGDYFRGMLIETLEDLGKSSNPEATIIQLKLENESLKHKHNVELAEIEKNMSTVLKDIQRSIIEDRDKIVDETRAQCELEAIKRIEEAKSKQWCANCSKEAQFYCCWNTSYCDYPCQQKHWPQHMSKCTQNLNQTPVTTAVHCPTGQPIILRPAHPPTKPGVGRFLTKPLHKVYMNRNIGTILPKAVKVQTPGHMAVVETSLGNFQVVGSPVTFRPTSIGPVKPSATAQFSPDKQQQPKQKVMAPVQMPVSTILDDSD